MEELLPASIVWRKDKVGFEPPQKQWMKDAGMEELLIESKHKLVNEGILKPQVLQKPAQYQAAHDDGNYDWRYLCAAQCL